MIDRFKKGKVAVLGVGVEGISTVRFLVEKGIVPDVLDEKEINKIDNTTLQELRKLNVNIVAGKNSFKNVFDYESIVRSPGISFYRKEIQDALKHNVVVTSQTKLFMDYCPCPIIGVTGTKGKGTTSALIQGILKKQGYSVYLGGNIGEPPLDFLSNLNPQSMVVLELSSFQLQDIAKSPHIGVVLMITSEHLAATKGYSNYHNSLEEYIAAKRNMLRFQTPQDFAVINRDYPASNESDMYTEGKVFYVSSERETENGCYTFGGRIWVNRGGSVEDIIETKDILLPGAHNLENVCAAVMVAKLVGNVQTKHITDVLKTFKGLPHRLQLVRKVNNVEYYDDSIATNPESTIAAIKAFSEPKILILGGESAGSDFTELGRIINASDSIRAIIGVGKDWEKIKSHIPMTKSQFLLIEGAKNMEQIVKGASTIAQPGDVVLLSPACKSYDMFESYKDRGEQFTREVNKI